MSEKKLVTVTVVNQEKYDGGPFNFGAEYESGSLNDVISSLLEIRNSIPEEYRDDARCVITSLDAYGGGHYANIQVSYNRPETDEEENYRLHREESARLAAAAKDRALLRQLKEKYGDE